jgi:hypothetical protein
LIGTSCRYAPVVFDSGAAQAGELVEVIARRATHEKIEAQQKRAPREKRPSCVAS